MSEPHDLEPEALDDLADDEDELLRFAGLLDLAVATGGATERVDDGTLLPTDLEELEARAVDLARIDPSLFIAYVFRWPMQTCHVEWQDFLTASPRAILWAPIEHGKTGQISIARPLFELGKDPSLRIATVSNTETQAAKCLSIMKQIIELHPRYHRVFPGVKRERRRGRRRLWHETAILIEREDTEKDPTIQALGIASSLIGSRVDLAILDDVLDFENTLHETARKRTIDWFDATVDSRLTAFGRVWCVGTAWHREDVMHVLAKRPGWFSRLYDGWETLLWPELVRVAGKWYGWPRWRLEQKRETTPALEFARQFRNRPLASGAATFHLETCEACYTDDPWDPDPEPGAHFYTGVDLNVSRKKGAAETCFFSVELLSDGTRRVQSIVSDVMDLIDIVWWFFRIEARLHPVLFLVENNAAQDYVRQLFRPDMLLALEQARGLPEGGLRAYAPRVEGFHTGKNKADPELGIRGMTLEFEQRKWRIPRHLQTAKWIDQLVDFDPLAHPGDVLMGSWFCHSACLKFKPRRLRARSLGGKSDDGRTEGIRISGS